jgi:hypothetical protein
VIALATAVTHLPENTINFYRLKTSDKQLKNKKASILQDGIYIANRHLQQV